jgi:hypothetical protein
VTFQVLSAASVKMSVFWDVAPRSLAKVYTLLMEAATTSATSINFYQTIWLNILEDSHLKCFPF